MIDTDAPGVRYLALALAGYQRWERDGDAGARADAIRYADQAVARGLPADQEIAAHQMVLLVEDSLTVLRVSAAEAGRFTRRRRRRMDRMFALLSGTPGLPPDEIAMAAVRCMSGELDVATMRPDPALAPRVRRWAELIGALPADALSDAEVDPVAAAAFFVRYGDLMQRAAHGEMPVEEIVALLGSTPLDGLAGDQAKALGTVVLGGALLGSSSVTNDLTMMSRAVDLLRTAVAMGGDTLPAEAELLAGFAERSRAVLAGDAETAARLLTELDERIRDLPPNAMTQLLGYVVARLSDGSAGRGALDTDLLSTGQRLVLDAMDAVDRALRVDSYWGLRLAVLGLASGLKGVRDDDPGVSRARLQLGLATNILASRKPERRGVRRAAVRRNADALRHLTDVTHPHFVTATEQLAEALRRRNEPGDRAASRSNGLAGLRGAAIQVLLQATPRDALDAALDAARSAVRLAFECASDIGSDPAAAGDLVRALEAGRGRVLDAVVVSRSVGAALAERGATELAAEWERSAGRGRWAAPAIVGTDVPIPSDLRRQAVRAVTADRTGAVAGVVPGPAEIGAALTTLAIDLLVYLVPGDAAGMAVVVTPDGRVVVRPLPDLSDIGPGSPLAAYLAALTAWLEPSTSDDTAAGTAWHEQLTEVGAWAWRAVGATLVDLAGPAEPTVVLVPFGQLAAVPWHCAWRGEDDRRRFLAQDLVLSTIPAARMLCDIASRPPTTAGATLVVGDPAADLAAAAHEAELLRLRFYPDATYLGTAPAATGPGTAAEILAWLADTTTPRRLLHLACHATVRPDRPETSAIEVAGGTLPVSELLDRWPTTRIELDTVVLSACSTDVSSANYDEAFAITTTFLALGARTALGTLWPVHDKYTSLFMYVFHHYLTTGDRTRPALALHRTRMWMLDPDRRPPAGLPADLCRVARGRGPALPLVWASFNHLGA